MGRYRWVWNGVEKLHDVGILADGTLHNPRGYPDDLVRQCVLAADERCRQARSEAAKKAAVTRARRRERKVYIAAEKIVQGHVYGPRAHCVICGKGVSDPPSIERGIGSDCWQDVLKQLEKRKAARAA
jgi:hypothetical protein